MGCCFGHKGEREQLLKNKRDIENNVAQINILKDLASKDQDLVTKIEEVQDMIKYFDPTLNDDAIKFDKKIADKIGDAKIILNKAAEKDDFSKAYDIINDIRSLAVERKNVRRD